ncbi:MAG: hypothetical protein WKF41_13270 [Gaiellaceae bacterium]
MARKPPTFDPFGTLQALDRHRVSYIAIGGFARVIQGTEEITRGLDIVPSTRPENLRRLDAALREINAERADGQELVLEEAVSAAQPTIDLMTDHGEVKVVPTPAGTRGYDDLRRAANREPLGRGVRPSVASIGDLARMISALGSEQHLGELRQLRRLVELERGRTRAIER